MIDESFSVRFWPAALGICSLLHFSACSGGEGAPSGAAVVIDDSITSDRCVLTVSYPAEEIVDLVDTRFDYTNVVGSFGEHGPDARCRVLVPEATRFDAVNVCEETCAQGETRSLYLLLGVGQALDDLAMHTPADLFECLFEGEGSTLGDFTGSGSLTGPFFADIEEVPFDVRVECDGWPSTTTSTSSTTTTLPCGGSSCEPGDRIPIELWLDDEIELGSLQFDVVFSSVVGAFDQFNPGNVKCTLAAGVNALFATNQVPRIDDETCIDCERRFSAGFVFSGGLTGPGKLAACEFVIGDQEPDASDFSVRVVDASDVDVLPIDPLPAVSVRLPGD